MVYVWDNGDLYSDHEVAFVEGADWPDDFVRMVLSLKAGHLALSAERVVWWEGEAMPLDAWFDPWDLVSAQALTPTYRAIASYQDQDVARRYLHLVLERLMRGSSPAAKYAHDLLSAEMAHHGA